MPTQHRRRSLALAALAAALVAPLATAPAHAVPAGTVSGTVELDGAPFADHVVLLYDRTNADLVRRASTDESGRYSFTVPVGTTYSVAVQETTWTLRTYAGDGTRASDRLWRTMDEEAQTLDVSVAEAGVVKGYVRDRRGAPVAGVQVAAQGVGRGLGPQPRGTTNANGFYVLPGLRPGATEVVPQIVQEVVFPVPAARVTVAAGESAKAPTLTLPDLGVVAGKFRTSFHSPVVLESASGQRLAVRPSQTGHFEVHVPVGSYRLAVGNGVRTPAVTVVRDGRTSMGVIPQSGAANGPTTVIGRVTSPSGPVADVAVLASDAYGVPTARARTGADGRFSLTGLRPGRFRLTYTPAGTTATSLGTLGPEAGLVTVPSGSSRVSAGTVELPRTVVVRGSVTGPDGPAARVSVRAPHAVVTTSETGAYELRVAGATTITFADLDDELLTRRIAVTGTADRTLDVTLTR
ncbi:carboxypeptidase-like regulatory domain-containing protein [Cellulomonas massiliensis]|uniref:carboxypeptidase-like regulatory domain-containing protein n=1 Tax=Cellulomonas massiliensis TaxID=1465811 RepID=UPI00031E466C|nr:carboxypeptidase-like regulatory domain-containing protein [Cellulomonas massiliensis]